MRIYVGNVPYHSSEQEIRTHFETVGTVAKVDVVTDRDTGRPRGFVFVDMDDKGAQRAIDELNGSNLGGRALTVNQAKDKPRPDYTQAGHDRARRGGYDSRRGRRERDNW